jgi:DNA-binding response OmpR family regulator
VAAAQLILLVDDIPDHVGWYQAALTDSGYRVETAKTGEAGYALARRLLPDCVIIDVRLPDMSGWDLCVDLKTDRDTRAIPVVILTPDAARSYADDSSRARCDAWITQPTMAIDLVRAVRHVLAQDDDAPRSPEDAVIGVVECPACASDEVRATIRVSPVQYYSCRRCGHVWRVEAL